MLTKNVSRSLLVSLVSSTGSPYALRRFVLLRRLKRLKAIFNFAPLFLLLADCVAVAEPATLRSKSDCLDGDIWRLSTPAVMVDSLSSSSSPMLEAFSEAGISPRPKPASKKPADAGK